MLLPPKSPINATVWPSLGSSAGAKKAMIGKLFVPSLFVIKNFSGLNELYRTGKLNVTGIASSGFSILSKLDYAGIFLKIAEVFSINSPFLFLL